MASMDNLRDKIRSRRADTSDLDAVHISAPTAALSDAFDQMDEVDEIPASEADFAASGNTDSLISEIFADDHHAVPVFGTHEKAAKAETRKAEPEPKPKKPLDLPFLNQLKKLEVNRKMLLISLAVAGVATFLSMAYLNSMTPVMIKVVSIKKDIPADTVLTQEMLDIREVPENLVPQGALVFKPNLPVLGKKTVAALYKGEILNSNRIVDPGIDGVNVEIPTKHKAIEIRAKNASLLHGSTPDQKEYIDLIASIPDPSPVRQGKIITYTILQRALVLKVGSGKDNSASASSSEAVTLAVPDDHVNLMIMLQEKSSFTAVPRSPTDENIKPDEYTVQEIEDALQGRFEAKSASSTPAPPAASAAPVKADPPAPAVPQGHGPDLSGGGGGGSSYSAPARSYSAPARSYSAPARSYSAPARSYSAPARTYTPPARAAAPAAAPSRPRTVMPRMTIQGGAVTQSGN